MNTDWTALFTENARKNKGSAIRELLSVIDKPEMISFAGGLPAPEAFAVEEVKATADDILTEVGPAALQYGPTEGYRLLREEIATRFRARGVQVGTENVLITSGAQQGLDLVGRLFLGPGIPVLVEAPTYVGALQAWNTCAVKYLTVPMDHDGMQVERLKSMGEFKVAYTVPNFQNPMGVTLSQERRQKLLDAVHQRNALIVEDDPYGRLRYSGEHVPSVVELEGAMFGSNWNAHGRVIYLGTFSKTLVPGLRIGWALAPAPVIRAMVIAKQGLDLHTSTLNQMIVGALMKSGTIERNLPRLCSLYHHRRDVMLTALEAGFAGRATWTHPDGGLFIWMTLHEGMDTEKLLARALEHNVAYVPGASFFANPEGRLTNTMRLNFSNMPPERIKEGVQRLAALVAEGEVLRA